MRTDALREVGAVLAAAAAEVPLSGSAPCLCAPLPQAHHTDVYLSSYTNDKKNALLVTTLFKLLSPLVTESHEARANLMKLIQHAVVISSADGDTPLLWGLCCIWLFSQPSALGQVTLPQPVAENATEWMLLAAAKVRQCESTAGRSEAGELLPSRIHSAEIIRGLLEENMEYYGKVMELEGAAAALSQEVADAAVLRRQLEERITEAQQTALCGEQVAQFHEYAEENARLKSDCEELRRQMRQLQRKQRDAELATSLNEESEERRAQRKVVASLKKALGEADEDVRVVRAAVAGSQKRCRELETQLQQVQINEQALKKQLEAYREAVARNTEYTQSLEVELGRTQLKVEELQKMQVANARRQSIASSEMEFNHNGGAFDGQEWDSQRQQEWLALQNQVEFLASQLEQSQAEIGALKAAAETAARRAGADASEVLLKELNSRLSEETAARAEAERALRAAETAAALLESQLNERLRDMEEALTAVEADKEHAVYDCERLRQSLANMVPRDEHENSILAAARETDQLKAQLQCADEKLRRLAEERSTAARSLQQLQLRAAEETAVLTKQLEEAKSRFESEMNCQSRMLEEKQVLLERALDQISSLTAMVKEQGDVRTTAEKSAHKAWEEVQMLQSAVSDKDGQLKALSGELKRKQTLLSSTEARLNEALAQLARLNRQLESANLRNANVSDESMRAHSDFVLLRTELERSAATALDSLQIAQQQDECLRNTVKLLNEVAQRTWRDEPPPQSGADDSGMLTLLEHTQKERHKTAKLAQTLSESLKIQQQELDRYKSLYSSYATSLARPIQDAIARLQLQFTALTPAAVPPAVTSVESQKIATENFFSEAEVSSEKTPATAAVVACRSAEPSNAAIRSNPPAPRLGSPSNATLRSVPEPNATANVTSDDEDFTELAIINSGCSETSGRPHIAAVAAIDTQQAQFPLEEASVNSSSSRTATDGENEVPSLKSLSPGGATTSAQQEAPGCLQRKSSPLPRELAESRPRLASISATSRAAARSALQNIRKKKTISANVF